jgi:hypothetical protein
MPRARNKAELITYGNKEYKALCDLVNMLKQEKLETTEVFENRTVKDIIAHLHAWHLLFFEWYKVGMSGDKPYIPAKGYTFKDTPKLNEKLYQEYKNIKWEAIYKDFKDSHKKIMEIIENHSEEDLTQKKKYKWTGSTNLASYLASATSSHYVWAKKLIKKIL